MAPCEHALRCLNAEGVQALAAWQAVPVDPTGAARHAAFLTGLFGSPAWVELRLGLRFDGATVSFPRPAHRVVCEAPR
ncbi:MAG: hypothetical protein ACYDHH_14945 [Solirubrobacteraceae bacterium]